MPLILSLLLVLGNLAVPVGGVSAAGTTYYVGTLVDDAGMNTANCGVPTNTDCTLRDAIAVATSGSDTILFRPGLSGTITLSNGTLTLATGVTITGPGADVLTVSGNNATQVFIVGWDYVQGGVANPNFNISGLTIANGSGVDGGAMNIGVVGTVTIANMTFADNTASDSGGAIYSYYGGRDSSTVMISKSTFSGNTSTNGGRGNNAGTAAGGGAIYMADFSSLQSVTITDSTFTGNQAAGIYEEGGAIQSYAQLSVVNSTITGNSANGGPGGISNTGGGVANLTNTIVAGNSGDFSDPDLAGNFGGSNNLIGGGNSYATFTGGNNLIGVPPLLGTLGNYGGPTQTIPLLPGSPAIGAGTTGTNVSTTDQRGVSRDGHVDIGAFQSQGFTITKISGDNQSTPAYAAFAQSLVVAVSSAYGEPVQDGIVTFTGPTSGAGIQGGPFADTIAGNGQATQAVTATSPGSYTVSASTTGATPVAFTLTNEDTDLALANIPADITINNSAVPTVVTYTLPTAVDEDADATVSCDPPSGSIFAVGVTTVTCTAADSGDLNSPVSATFTVTVGDFDLSLTNIPADITVPATSASGSVVSYTPPTAVDEDGDATVSCTPASGSTFPHGTTTVTCTTSDADDANSPVSASFTVTVTATIAITTCDETTLQDAIANAKRGDTLTFECGGTITLMSPITLNTDLTIDGSGQQVVISGGGTSGVFVNRASVVLNDLTIANGNGGISNQGTLTITDCTFSDNSGTDGGAIYNFGSLSVIGCTFNGNSAIHGGAIYDDGTLTVTNSTFSGNSAIDGGAIYESLLYPTVTNSTFSGNSATNGGAIFVNSGIVFLKNSIVANSPTGGNCGFGPAGFVANQGGNLADDSSCSVPSVSTGSLVLGSLTNNGGPTQTIALGTGSVAIDATVCDASITTDQRGLPRPDNGATTCDSGAYEVQDTATSQTTILSTVSGSGQFGGTATLTATLTANDTGVAGLTIDFTLNGTAVGSATTDNNGVAITLGRRPRGISAGSYPDAVGASFAAEQQLRRIQRHRHPDGRAAAAKADQTISFDLSSLPAKTFGDPSFDIGPYASASSGLSVSFSSPSSAVCTVSGSTVTHRGGRHLHHQR